MTMTLVAQIKQDIVEDRRRAGIDKSKLLARLVDGRVEGALDDLFYFLPPRDALWCLRQLGVAFGRKFPGLPEPRQESCIDFLKDLSVGLSSFLPRWNLLDFQRHGDAALTETQVEQQATAARDLVAELTKVAPGPAARVLQRLRLETCHRYRAEKAEDPQAAAQALVGASLAQYIDHLRAELVRSNLRRISEMRGKEDAATELGNDYASFLRHAMHLGASFATTNPVLVKIAWDTDPARWDCVVDGLITKNPEMDADGLGRLFTLEVVLDSMLQLRPIFLLTEGAKGLVCLQVDPRKHDDSQAMISYALATYEDLRARLNGGRPNVVFKLPGTKAGLEACCTLTRQGIGVTITVNFGMFQHVPFARAINEGNALVSYLVVMNGRLAYPVRDELLGRLDELAGLGIDEARAREAAAWAGVAVVKRLQRLLKERGHDMGRMKPLVASLRIYEGYVYDGLPSKFPDITEVLGTGVISVFPDVRRAFDLESDLGLAPRQVEEPLDDDILEVLSHSEIFRQAYYVADREWVPDEDQRFRPQRELTLGDEEGTVSWPPVRDTLGQFMKSYESLLGCIARRM